LTSNKGPWNEYEFVKPKGIKKIEVLEALEAPEVTQSQKEQI
jgi:hypothetical protein